MGGALSFMAPPELRREETARGAEICNMLLESDAFLHSHRTLRRELCVTRIVILVLLLLLCATFSLLFFFQPRAACNVEGRHGKPDETPFAPGAWKGAATEKPGTPTLATLRQTPSVREVWMDAPTKIPETPASANLLVLCPASHSGNIKWQVKQSDFVGFNLTSDNSSLIVNQDGTYRISLQVTYRGIEDAPCRDQILLSHRLELCAKGYPKIIPILDFYETVNVNCNQEEPLDNWRKSMYSEAVETLQKGDTLSVHSSQLSLLDCDGHVGLKTFLRVHLKSTG